jgi:hypothetical protein
MRTKIKIEIFWGKKRTIIGGLTEGKLTYNLIFSFKSPKPKTRFLLTFVIRTGNIQIFVRMMMEVGIGELGLGFHCTIVELTIMKTFHVKFEA